MATRLVAEDENGRQYLIVTEDIGGANVVLRDVPCFASVNVGHFVRMDENGIAVRAIADSLENSNVLGCVESKSDSNLCDVRVLGITAEIFDNLDVTKEYFLSDTINGGISQTVPLISGHVRLKVGQPFSSKRMLIMKGERIVRG